jgi:hypothetical protein
MIMPLLALGGVIIGTVLLAKGSAKPGQDIGIIVASVVIGVFSFFFWVGLNAALY